MASSELGASYPHFGTLATHAGQEPEQWSTKAIVPPITLSTTFKQTAPGEAELYEYGRTNNPSRLVFEKCIAALEGAKYGVASGSGVGSNTMICQMLTCGDNIVAMEDTYSGSCRFFSQVLANSGIDVTYVDTSDTDKLRAAIKPNTKMIWAETLTNPMLRFVDLRPIAKVAKEKNVLLVVDNTLMTPYFIRPLEKGADIVYHSVSKYLNGHSDVIMGAICTNNEQVFKRLRSLQNSAGGVPGPFDCYMANRGLKTLHVRMREHQCNAMAVAQFLQSSPHVVKVIYPGLPSHPNHEMVRDQAKGYGGIITFAIKGTLDNVKKFFKAVKVVTFAESFGTFDSLVGYPLVMTHSYIPKEKRDELGVSENLVRMSVGLEDIEDILEDLKQALEVSQ